MRAVENKIIVEAIEDEYKVWDIDLENREEKPSHGIVISVGEGRFLENGMREKMDVRVWDEIYFTRYVPDMFEVDDKVYYSLKQSSILAVLDNKKEDSKKKKKDLTYAVVCRNVENTKRYIEELLNEDKIDHKWAEFIYVPYGSAPVWSEFNKILIATTRDGKEEKRRLEDVVYARLIKGWEIIQPENWGRIVIDTEPEPTSVDADYE